MVDTEVAHRIRSWLVEHLAAELGLEKDAIAPGAPFDTFGLSSQQAVTLSGDLEEWLGRTLPATLVWDYPTIEALAAHLAAGDGEDDGGASVPPRPPSRPDDPIAIVGIACRFPGAEDPEAFWRLLRGGVDAISEVPADRWDREAEHDLPPGEARETVARWGGFLTRIDGFDAVAFGITPREAARMDPQQRLVLEVSWEALEDAGLPVDALAGSATGVFIGISTSDYAQRRADVAPDLHIATGNAHSIAANRVSYLLDLRGPSIAVDTACSSSLVAVHLACQSLRLGECATAIAGGVNVLLSPDLTIAFAQAGAMARDGRCKAFDARADGYVRGEGCGMVVLKRLADAERDGDRVHAVIRGTAINQDGRTNGLTAPNRLAQEAVIRQSWRDAGMDPAAVGYVEAHGTGTPLGDPIEIGALRATYLAAPDRRGPLVVGSVKTNFGHLEAAAGVAGLIKTVLALRHREIPAHLHLTTPNPLLDTADGAVQFPTSTRPWPEVDGTALAAAVSSFGFGGTNVHVLLDAGPPGEAPRRGSRTDTASAWLLPLSARDPEALRALADRHVELLEGRPEIPLSSICAAAAVRRAHHPWRLACVARSREEMSRALRAAGERRLHGSGPGLAAGRGKRIAFVFPGQGPQHARMGRQLIDAEPAFRAAFEACSTALLPHLGAPAIDWLVGDGGEWVDRVDRAQPLLWAFEVAMAALWRSWGVEPVAVVGHSMGELAAAASCGLLSLTDAASLICTRSALLQCIRGTGAMALVELPADRARDAVAEFPGITVAASNGPRATVLAGDRDAIEALLARLLADGVDGRWLDIDFAAHSAAVEPLQDELVRAAAGMESGAATSAFYSTVLGARIDPASVDARYWGRNLREPVRFAETVAQMVADGFDVFLEVGPRPSLTAALQDALADSPARAVAALRRPPSLEEQEHSEQAALLDSLGALYEAGCDVDWRRRHGEAVEFVALPTYPWQRRRYWLEASPHRSRPADGDSAILQLRWTPLADVAVAATPPAGRAGDTWALIGDGGATAVAMAAALAASGARCVGVEATDPELARHLAGRRGVILLHDRPVAAVHADLAAAAAQALERLRLIARTMAAVEDPPRLWIVTRGAQAVGDEAPALDGAALWGMGRVIGLEQSAAWGGMIDLDPARDESADIEAAAALRLLLREGDERLWALRGGQPHVPRLRPVALAPTDGQTFAVRPGTAVLITGGTGALGRATARWLAALGAGRIVLLSRTACHEDVAELREQLAGAGTALDVLAADVADPTMLAAALDSFRASHPGTPIRGVVHAAAVPATSPTRELTASTLERALAPKLVGAANLHRLFGAASDLDFFVMHSSIAAWLPTRTAAGYTAASAFLDALATHRRSLGLPALSVQWGPWATTGLTERSGLNPLLVRLGLRPLRPERALQLLGRLLAEPTAGGGAVAIVDADWDAVADNHAAFGAGTLHLVQGLQGQRGAARTRAPLDAAARPATSAPPPARDAVAVERYLRERVGDILYQPADRVPIDVPLTRLGLDSLVVMEIILAIERDHGIRLYPREIIEQPDLGTLAGYVAGELARQAGVGAASGTAAQTVEAAGTGGPARAGRAAFILSCPRSGSTLLRVMLAGHPALFAPPELHLLPFASMQERRAALRESYLDEGLVRALMELQHVDRAAAAATVSDWVTADVAIHEVYARLQRLCGDRLLIDKSPTYASSTTALTRAESLFDAARYIAIVRHPLAAIESMLRHRFHRLLGKDDADPMALAESIWVESNVNLIDFLAAVPEDRRLTIRYEDLVREPRRIAESVCAFLAIDYDEALLTPYAGARMTDGLHARSMATGDPDFLSHDRIDARLADAWRSATLPRPPGPLVRRVAAELGYRLPASPEAPRSSRPGAASRPAIPADRIAAAIGRWVPAVPLQPQGEGAPLFMVHPASGTVYPYYELAKALAPDVPLWGLQDVTLGGVREPLASIDAYADEYLEGIRQVQPHGPYAIGGWSFGGHVAVAMARRLRADGERVALLLVVDSEAPVDRRALSWRERLRVSRNGALERANALAQVLPVLRDGMYLLSEMNRNSLRRGELELGPLGYLRFRWNDALRRTIAGDSRVGKEIARIPEFRTIRPPTATVLAGVNLFRRHVALVRSYRPQPYDGDMTLLRAQQQIHRRYYSTDALGWEHVVGGRIRVLEIPGDHATMFREPHVATLASTIRECLARM